MKYKILLLFVSLFISANVFAKVGTKPCIDPLTTINWAYFIDDFIIGSYGDSDSLELSYEDSDGDGRSDGGGLCFCKKTSDGRADGGLKIRFSEPIGFVELVNTPYKFTCFEGDSGKGGWSKLFHRGNTTGYRNAHFIQYPVFALMNYGMDQLCLSKEFPLDVPFIGELTPFWNDDFTALLTNPVAALTANPIAQMACGWDCSVSTLKKPNEYLSWCNGCWQGRRLNTGRSIDGNQVQSDAALVMSVLDFQHSTYQLPQTIQIPGSGVGFLEIANFWNSNEIACGDSISYFPKVIKNQYLLQNVYPTSNSYMITPGEHGAIFSNFRIIPQYQDRIFAIWRRKVCCVGLINASKLF